MSNKKRSTPPASFEIHAHERAHNDFFVLHKLDVSYETFSEDLTARKRNGGFEVFERGDAAAALLFHPDRNAVVLVQQFRLPTTDLFRRHVANKGEFIELKGDYSGRGGWLLETAAGTVFSANETPEACIRREVMEEVGYRVTDLKRVTEFFSSPGGTNELVHLFFAEVTDWQKKGEGGGDSGRTEDIEVVEIPVEEFFAKLLRQEFRDPKIIIAGYWLREHLAKRRIEPKNQSRCYEHDLLIDGRPTGQIIGIRTGDIADISGVEVWINPENTNMLMDRFFGKSVSAAIRWHGAEKRSTNTQQFVERDLIADELRSKLQNRHYVALKEIVETGPGELKEKGVRLLLHVAIAEGYYEQGLKTNLPTLESCLDLTLEHIERKNRSWTPDAMRPFRSVLVPMLGAGQGGLSVRDVAPVLVKSAMAFFDEHRKSRLQRIYLNTFTSDDFVTVQALLDGLVHEKKLSPGREA